MQYSKKVYKHKRDELEQENVCEYCFFYCFTFLKASVLQVPRDAEVQENETIHNQHGLMDSITCSPLFQHSELAPEVYPYSPVSAVTHSRPCTPPPLASRVLSPIKGIWNNTVRLLSPKKKHARTDSRPSSPSPQSAQPLGCPSESAPFALVTCPRMEMEDIPNEDALECPEILEWNGESTFWGPCHDSDSEFFDDEDDAPEWDGRPIEDIPDPEGEDTEEDHATSETTAKPKGKFIFPPSRADAKQAFNDLTALLFPKRMKGQGLNRKKCKLDKNTRDRLEHVRSFLHLYVE